MEQTQDAVPERANLRKLLLATFFSVLTCVSASIVVPIPYVPITMQSFVVLMAGLLLGARYGAVSQALYLLLGLLGLPVFAGGKGGLHHILSPSFGFLVGFIPAAFTAGYLVPKGPAPWWRFSLACFAATAVLYAVGLPLFWLNMNFVTAPQAGMTFVRTMKLAFVPFILPDSLKALLAGLLAAKTQAVLKSR